MKDLFSFLKKVYFFKDLPEDQIKKIQDVLTGKGYLVELDPRCPVA